MFPKLELSGSERILLVLVSRGALASRGREAESDAFLQERIQELSGCISETMQVTFSCLKKMDDWCRHGLFYYVGGI